MPPFLRSSPALVGLAVVVVLMSAVGFIPLFGGPGYESALAAGLIVPFAVAVTVALEVSLCPRAEPFDAVCRGVTLGAVFALAAYATTLLHGLRTGFCNLPGGSAQFALGPGAGALLAGGWGALAGVLAGRRQRTWTRRLQAVALGAALPLASILASVVRFYASPMVFAYDPFVGYFSGSLYDTVIDFSGVITYRAGSAATLLATFVAAYHVGPDERGRLRFRRRGRPAALVLGGVALAASLATIVAAPRLGHFETPRSIAAELGAHISGDRCDVIYARSIRLADAERFLRECDAHVAAGERWFEARGADRFTAYLFADSAQKGALMGAADTYIAKPWRREVYVQAAGYPHPVLGHELVHAIAGSFGRGPFRIAGSFGGLLPNPGLVEGVAVAAAPREGDLTPREWAKAMKDLGILPQLDRLFALGFLAENASTAYTVSGAFVGWVHDRYGAAAVRAWYGGKDLAALAGAPWAEIEQAWHDDLDQVVLPDAARAQAKARFDHPAIFGRRCPHVVDECKGRAEHLYSIGDEEGAITAFGQVLALDPGDAGTRISVAKAKLREGKADDAARDLEGIAADEAVPRHVRDRAMEELGDLALAQGRGDAAIARYAEVKARTLDEDRLRTIEVKEAAASSDSARPAVVALLIGAPGRAPDRVLAAGLLGVWATSPGNDGLPLYLLGRQIYGGGDFVEAAVWLDRALAAPIAIPRVEIEAARLRMVAACALEDGAGAARMYARYAAYPGVSTARREAARALVERCGGAVR